MAKITGSVGQSGKNLPADVTLVQTLLNRHKAWLSPALPPAITGKYDAATGTAIKAFQSSPGALLTPDGVVSPHGFTLRWLDRAMISEPAHRVFLMVCWSHPVGGITADDYAAAAKTLDCEAAAIQAVAQVETQRAAWDDFGRPTILFERHYFSDLTGGKFNASHPDISNPVAGGYGTYSAQFPKLHRASLLDESAALQSASWGTFQIMGRNYVAAGFGSVAAFVDAMLAGEKRHLEAFVNFIAASAAKKKALKDKDWAKFALLYNGTGYKKNDYDTKMATAYAALTAPPPKAKAAR